MLIPSLAILGFHAFDTNVLEDVSTTGIGYEGVGPERWYDRNIGLLPSGWAECERRVLQLPPDSTSAVQTLDAHQRDIINRILLHGADDSRVDPSVTRAPELRGSATEMGRGQAPTASGPRATGKGRRGGGNAPLVWVPRSDPASTRPSDFRPGDAQHPRDQFGCYVIPPDFPLRGYSFEQWQRFWHVPEEYIMTAMAYHAGMQEALRQRDVAPAPAPQAAAPMITWECNQCRGTVAEEYIFCGRCGHPRYGPPARLPPGGGNAPGPAAAAVVTQGFATVGGQHPTTPGPVPATPTVPLDQRFALQPTAASAAAAAAAASAAPAAIAAAAAALLAQTNPAVLQLTPATPPEMPLRALYRGAASGPLASGTSITDRPTDSPAGPSSGQDPGPHPR